MYGIGDKSDDALTRQPASLPACLFFAQESLQDISDDSVHYGPSVVADAVVGARLPDEAGGNGTTVVGGANGIQEGGGNCNSCGAIGCLTSTASMP